MLFDPARPQRVSGARPFQAREVDELGQNHARDEGALHAFF